MAPSLICRQWRGRLPTGREDAYLDYFRQTGAVDYNAAAGCVGYELRYREVGDGTTEVTTISWWVSAAHIAAFAGPDIATARYYPRDAEYLVEMPPTVDHFRVADRGPEGSSIGGD